MERRRLQHEPPCTLSPASTAQSNKAIPPGRWSSPREPNVTWFTPSAAGNGRPEKIMTADDVSGRLDIIPAQYRSSRAVPNASTRAGTVTPKLPQHPHFRNRHSARSGDRSRSTAAAAHDGQLGFERSSQRPNTEVVPPWCSPARPSLCDQHLSRAQSLIFDARLLGAFISSKGVSATSLRN